MAERGGYDLMPEMGFKPTNKYLPPRPGKTACGSTGAPSRLEQLVAEATDAVPQGAAIASTTGGKLLADRALSQVLKSDWPKTIDELERKRGSP